MQYIITLEMNISLEKKQHVYRQLKEEYMRSFRTKFSELSKAGVATFLACFIPMNGAITMRE